MATIQFDSDNLNVLDPDGGHKEFLKLCLDTIAHLDNVHNKGKLRVGFPGLSCRLEEIGAAERWGLEIAWRGRKFLKLSSAKYEDYVSVECLLYDPPFLVEKWIITEAREPTFVLAKNALHETIRRSRNIDNELLMIF